MLITLYVLYNMMAKLKKTLRLFLQGVPENVDLTAFEHELLAIDKVKSTHHTHIWSLDGEQHVLSTHLVVDGKTTKNETLRIKKKVRNLIKSLNVQHITIEVEYQNQDPECF
jgi:cobalt-zinc-cadmium efflux system protein